MRLALFAFFTSSFCCTISVQAQLLQTTEDERIVHLTSRILEKVPDERWTRDALGTTEERQARAKEHATLIVNASDTYMDEWEDIAEEAGWTKFQPQRDLPALISAVAYHESSFRSVVRLDDNSIVKTPPKKGLSDLGVLQVRAPSATASNCGVENKKDIARLVTDLAFAYMTGTCILTKRIAAYIKQYRSKAFTRFNQTERANYDLAFYGAGVGAAARQANYDHYKIARELVVVERYNWGDKDLYLHALHGGYARRIITLFEFFRVPKIGGHT